MYHYLVENRANFRNKFVKLHLRYQQHAATGESAFRLSVNDGPVIASTGFFVVYSPSRAGRRQSAY